MPYPKAMPTATGGKVCFGCRVDRPLTEFSPSRNGALGRASRCKHCRRAIQSAKYAADPRRLGEYRRLRQYNLTPCNWTRLLIEAGGRCGACGSTEELCVDHRHDTGAIRGVLCRKCNSAIGMLGDNPDGLWRALAYLEARHG